MRADNHGEGGILALTALVMREGARRWPRPALLVSLGVFGTALLYGDGIITPAISVLSAVEGLEEVVDLVRRLGHPDRRRHPHRAVRRAEARHRRGRQGVRPDHDRVVRRARRCSACARSSHGPEIIQSINPIYGRAVLQPRADARRSCRWARIFLVVTGGEALYADMGHFGRKPIAVGWYAHGAAGAGAELLRPGRVPAERTPRRSRSRSSSCMAPEVLKLPLVDPGHDGHDHRVAGAHLRRVLAHRAGGAARLPAAHRASSHTSQQHPGQVYVPLVNWAADGRLRRARASASRRRAPWRRRTASRSR